jgi:hypothetical protein
MCRSCSKRRYQSAANPGPLPIRKTPPSSFTATRRLLIPRQVRGLRANASRRAGLAERKVAKENKERKFTEVVLRTGAPLRTGG